MQTPLRGWVQVLMCKSMQALVWHTYSCLFFIVISESLFLTLASAARSGFPFLTADAWHGNHWTHPFRFPKSTPLPALKLPRRGTLFSDSILPRFMNIVNYFFALYCNIFIHFLKFHSTPAGFIVFMQKAMRGFIPSKALIRCTACCGTPYQRLHFPFYPCSSR